MSSDDNTTAQLDRELRELLRSQAEAVTRRPHVMTEVALRDSARRKQRRELRLVGAAVATAAVVVAALLIGPLGLDRSDSSLPADPEPTADVQPRKPAAGEVDTIQLPGDDASAAFAALGYVFVRLRSPAPTIAKVDPATNTVVGSVSLPDGLRLTEGIDPVVAAGSLWWSGAEAVYRMDPRSMTIAATIPVNSRWAALASDGRHVWVADRDGITDIDVATNSLVEHNSIGSEPQNLSFTGGSLWAAVGTSLLELDAGSKAVVGRTTLPGKLDLLNMLAVDDSLWVAVNGLDRLVHVDSDGDVEASVQLPRGSLVFDEFDPQLGSSSDGRTIWSMTAGGELVAVDVSAGEVVDRIDVSDSVYHSQVAVTDDAVWVPIRSTSTVLRFQWRDR